MIVEIRRGDKIYYCRGDVPDQIKHDILALKYQAKLGKDITPAELYARIPIVKPTKTELVFLVNEENGIYKLKSFDDFNSFPEWSWDQIYNFAGAFAGDP